MTIPVSIGKRIALLRPLLILGIVYVHTGGVGDAIAWKWSNPFEYLLAVFRDGLFRAGVPMLTLISGYLLFGSNLDRFPLKLLRKKFRTLAVPFVVFNLGFIAIMLPMEVFTGFSHRNVLIGADTQNWANYLFAITGSPYNYPLYFLRDMMVLVLLAPLFGWLLRNTPLIGLVAISGIFYFDFDSYIVLRSTSAILFYVGGMAALYRWDLHVLDKYAKLCALLVVLSCLIAIAMRIQDRSLLSLGLPFLIWPASGLLHDRGGALVLKYSKYSFFIFVAHAPIMFFSWELVLRYARFIPFPIYYVLAPAVTVAFLVAVYELLNRYVPITLDFVLGNRNQQRGPLSGKRIDDAGALAPVEPSPR